MTATAWETIAGLTIATVAIKALGPVAFGARRLPGPVERVVPLLAPALLAGLVVSETVSGSGRSLVIDARLGGLAAAALALWRGAPPYVVVVAAAAVTAALRALGIG